MVSKVSFCSCITLFIVPAIQRRPSHPFSFPRRMNKSSVSIIYPDMGNFPWAVGAEKHQMSFFKLGSIYGFACMPLRSRWSWKIQSVQAVYCHGKAAAVKPLFHWLAAPPVGYTDEAVCCSQNFISQVSLWIILGSDDIEIVDNSFRRKRLSPVYGGFSGWKITESNLV